MSIKVILFDLDGTLLPMDQDIFVKSYFSRLAKKLSPHGYEADKLIKAVWTGTEMMIKNTGEKTNEEVFWDTFSKIFGENSKNDIPLFEEFYKTDFQNVKNDCGYNEKSSEIISYIKEKGLRIALATNPIFPAIATKSRVKWAGLDISDFELYTTYENSRYSKPNIKYYNDIVSKLNIKPEECLMVGNDVCDDMVAKEIGMKVFLLTDCLINKNNEDISVYQNGSYDELENFIIKNM